VNGRVASQASEAKGIKDELFGNDGPAFSAARHSIDRVAIHEYNFSAAIDASSLELTGADPDPRILPFPECPGAVHNTQRLISRRITDIHAVPEELRGPQGCTHLNDALRALAEVPKLAGYLG